MEWLDIVDEQGQPTGERVERERAHREGIRHRTSHVWIARIAPAKSGEQKSKEQNNEEKNREENFLKHVELLIQRRSMDKDSHPGCLDISSAGHIPAGCSYVESALRELSEELGITAKPEELHFCGKRRRAYQRNFHGELFSDNQVSNVYVMFRDVKAEDIVFQQSEISEVFWMPFWDVFEMAKEEDEAEKRDGERDGERDGKRTIKTCISYEEMGILHNFLCDHRELLNKKKGTKLTTLCYIENDEKYLMLYRNKKKDDQSAGKWLGIGGKLEPGESPADCVLREVYEETGLILKNVRFRGIITFVSDIWENELMFLYSSDNFTGDLVEVCSEGDLKWIPKEEVLSLPAWEGDKVFLKPLLEGKDGLHVKLVYEGDKLVSIKDDSCLMPLIGV